MSPESFVDSVHASWVEAHREGRRDRFKARVRNTILGVKGLAGLATLQAAEYASRDRSHQLAQVSYNYVSSCVVKHDELSSTDGIQRFFLAAFLIALDKIVGEDLNDTLSVFESISLPGVRSIAIVHQYAFDLLTDRVRLEYRNPKSVMRMTVTNNGHRNPHAETLRIRFSRHVGSHREQMLSIHYTALLELVPRPWLHRFMAMALQASLNEDVWSPMSGFEIFLDTKESGNLFCGLYHATSSDRDQSVQ